MPSLTCFNVRFTPNWPMIILAVLFIAVFMRLGFWQIQRAAEKKQMVAAELAQAVQQPVAWTPNKKLPTQYQNILVEGHYLPNLFFLDNQHHQHRFGYDVLSPLQLANGTIILVDRGWMAGDNTRHSLPQVEFPLGLIKLQGSVYFPSNKQWILGPDLEEKGKKITVVERIDTKLISQILQKKVYPFIIRLNKQDAYGFVREWAIVSMPPERHLGYALQWFAMALIILIIFVALNLKKKR